MKRYLISFTEDAMTFPEEDLPAVDEAAHAVVRDAKAAGVWVFGAGLDTREVSVVDTDGSVSPGQAPVSTARLGGFAIVDVASDEEGLAWAARIAVACRCAQEVRELIPDPDA